MTRGRPAAAAVCAVLVLLLCSSCAAVAAGEGLLPAATWCVINILGSGSEKQPDTIQSAAWECEGGAVVAAVDPVLRQFVPGFKGVRLDPRCATPGCLISFCGDSISSPAVNIRDSSLTDFTTSRIHSMLCAVNSSSLTLNSSIVSKNYARAVYGTDDADINVHNSVITDNWQANGGGLRIDGNAQLSMVNSSVMLNWGRNSSGAGLYVAGFATAVLTNVEITLNFCGAQMSGNSLGSGAAFSLPGAAAGGAAAGGFVQGGAGFGGGIAVVGDGTVVLNGNSTVSGNIADEGGGVSVSDRGHFTAAATVRWGHNKVVLPGVAYHVYARGGNINLPPVDFVNQQMDREELVNISKCSRGVQLARAPCGDGEFIDPRSPGICVCCPERSYSFDNSSICRPCPASAACPGGNTVQPLPGFWRANLTSDIINKCPLGVDACAGRDQCGEGYAGNLCGACDAFSGYGHVSPLRCSRCMDPRLQLGLYALISFVGLGFVGITVHYTWKDNSEGSSDLRPSDIIKLLVQFLQYLVIIGSLSGVPWQPDFVRGMFRASSVVFGVASGQAMSLDCLLQQFQARFGVGSGGIPRPMQVQLFTLLSPLLVFVGVCAFALLCWGALHCVNKAYQALTGGGGGCSMPPCCCCCCSCCGGGSGSGGSQCQKGGVFLQPPSLQEMRRKLPVTALVVMVFAYPTLLRASLAFFVCLRIDNAAVFSVLDVNQRCWAGYHLRWALGLGIPSVLLTCVVIPVGLLWLLKTRAPADDPAFREQFGFFYRNYRKERCWWEAVWCVQTVLLSAVAVFHFSLEAYYSMLLLCLIFVASATLQNAFKPYTLSKLHQVHYASTGCLFLTVLGGLAMFPVDKSPLSIITGLTVLSVLIIVMDVGFICYCLHAAVASRQDAMEALFSKASSLLSAWSSGRLGSAISSSSNSATKPSDSASSQQQGPKLPGEQQSLVASAGRTQQQPQLVERVGPPVERVPE